MTGAVALFKGARSVIASPTGEVYINSTGNPGMATPGMGDALSGMVGALLGQRMAPLRRLALGVFLHGYAADRVAMRHGRVGTSSATCSTSSRAPLNASAVESCYE